MKMSQQQPATRFRSTGRGTSAAFVHTASIFRITAIAVIVLFAVSGLLTAQTTATSSAYGESVNIRLLPAFGNSGATLSSGPLPLAAGTAAPAFNRAGNLATLSTGPTGRVLAAGLLAVHAASALPGAETANADATVTNLALDVVSRLPLLSVRADAVRSTAAISGSCAGGPVLTGTTALVNAKILGIRIAASPAPNTVLVSLPGLRLVLNEQITTHTAAGVSGLTVNAFHLSLNTMALLGIGLLSGDVVLSQSHVEIACAPTSADLGITIQALSDPVQQGGVLTYALSITNSGVDPADQVVVTDFLPAGVTFVATFLDPGTGSCSGTTTIVCNLTTFQPGEQRIVQIEVRADALGLLTDTATVSSATPDSDLADKTASVTSAVENSGPVQFKRRAHASRSASRPPT